MIYIASPYSSDETTVMQARYEQVSHFTAKVFREGGVPYSPIVHGHYLSLMHSLPGDFAFWQRHCLTMLSNAKVMYVLMLDGWRDSVGVQAEIAFAEQNGIGICYFEPDDYEVAA